MQSAGQAQRQPVNKNQKTHMKKISLNGISYEYAIERCVDSFEIAINLDLGNGRPETIGYLPADAPESLVKALVIEELEAAK